MRSSEFLNQASGIRAPSESLGPDAARSFQHMTGNGPMRSSAALDSAARAEKSREERGSNFFPATMVMIWPKRKLLLSWEKRFGACRFASDLNSGCVLFCGKVSGKSYHRRPGRYAIQKQEFEALIQKLKRVALEYRYTKRELAEDIGISLPCLNQWLRGQTTFSRSEHLARLKEFLSAH